MKKLLAFLVLIITSQMTFSQTDDDEIDRILKNGGNVCFDDMANWPSFPGGDAALGQWLTENLQYPPDAVKNGIQGTVVVQFTVEIDGSIKNIKVVRSKSKSLDKEAVRLMSIMPKWNPRKKDGQPVSAYYTLPIKFRLPASESDETILNERVYSTDEVDVQPEFPGGETAMYQWIEKNLSYPPEMADGPDVIGTVKVQFVIEKDGTVSNIQIMKSLYPLLDKEAIRIVRMMPKWKPGMINGQSVRVSNIISVKFMLK